MPVFLWSGYIAEIFLNLISEISFAFFLLVIKEDYGWERWRYQTSILSVEEQN